MLRIQSDHVAIVVDSWMGGGVLSFTWHGIDIFRPFQGGKDMRNLGSFPLVPFCNRIAGGCLTHRGKSWMLPPAPLGIEPLHALHGLGWRSPWSTIESGEALIRLGLNHDGVLWPWPFSAEQRFEVTSTGLVYSMSATNHGSSPMPTGLGLHPYFPRDGAHFEFTPRAQWETGKDRLPIGRKELSGAPDWFNEEGFDHCFEGADAPLTITWPTHRLRILPSQTLPFVHVYTPAGEDFFCVEPVSHIPDAVNSPHDSAVTGLMTLAPGETMEIECRFEVEAIS